MIEWNRVTWYSKLCAVVLFVGVFALGGYLGVKYEREMPRDYDIAVEDIVDEQVKATALDPQASWARYRNEAVGVEFKYPREYEVIENPPPYTVAGIESVPLLVREKGKETTGNTIAFTKVQSTVNDEVAKRFDWSVTSVDKNYEGVPPLSYILSYYTGDAFSVRKTYLYSLWRPTSPFDQGDTPMDVVVAEVDGLVDEVNGKSAVETIMDTVFLCGKCCKNDLSIGCSADAAF